MNELACAVGLSSLPGVGPARLDALLNAWAPVEAWNRVMAGTAASHSEIVSALGRDLVSLPALWRRAASAIDPDALLEATHALGIAVGARGQAGYPSALADDPEAPALVFYRGDLEALDRRRVAIVGTRNATEVGLEVAVELGHDLARAGVAVVSGLAVGVDAAAHRGVLLAEAAPPVGVVGSGLDVVYPRSSAALWREVAAAGLLLSEAPPGARPETWRFPARNRMIAALAEVVVVVESRTKGGSLHTVESALARGRTVTAVPGSVRSAASDGTNELLIDGAPPVRHAGDVLALLGLETPPHSGLALAESAPVEPGPIELAVLGVVRRRAADLDGLVRATAHSLGEVSVALAQLGLAGLVIERAGWYEHVRPPVVAR